MNKRTARKLSWVMFCITELALLILSSGIQRHPEYMAVGILLLYVFDKARDTILSYKK